MPDNPLAKASFNRQRHAGSRIRRAIAAALPPSVKRNLRIASLLPLDLFDTVLGRRKELVPPRYLNYAGDGDFEATGNEFCEYFTVLGGLTPEHRVLEMGCGIGRMARPLTRFLTTGSYEGVDVVPDGIRWCQQNVTTRYPNFRFDLADIKSAMYNPRGRFSAVDYVFPFRDAEFDFIFLTSVFTHMMKAEVQNYLREISRVLRPGGRSFVTFFLMNEQAWKLIEAGRSSLTFQFPRDGGYLNDPHTPDKAVSFDESIVQRLYRDVGLTIDAVKYGSWCGRSSYVSYQDIVIARKA